MASASSPVDDDATDPQGLPRLVDYELRSISRHTLSDKLPDAEGRLTDQAIGRVEVREYKLDRYARRPPAAPEEMLRHYRRQLAVIGGVTLSQTKDRLSGRYLRNGLPVLVTIEVRRGGSHYEVTTGGPGTQAGVNSAAIEPEGPSTPSPEHPVHRPAGHLGGETGAPSVVSSVGASAGNTANPPSPDGRAAAASRFRMPASATLWPRFGTRGMAVLLAGPGVNQAVSIRFGTTEAEILARQTARVRVRVPVLASGQVPVVVHYENGSEPVGSGFLILDTPPQDAQATAVPPCDGIPGAIAGVSQVSPQPVRPGQILRLSGRGIDRSTHITFTVAQHEVDPHARGLDPDLVGIDFGASARARSAPRWLDTLATHIGRAYGASASVPGICDSGNTAGYAAIRKTGDREGEVCVPALALSGPIGLWRAAGSTGDTCDTSDFAVQISRSPSRR